VVRGDETLRAAAARRRGFAARDGRYWLPCGEKHLVGSEVEEECSLRVGRCVEGIRGRLRLSHDCSFLPQPSGTTTPMDREKVGILATLFPHPAEGLLDNTVFDTGFYQNWRVSPPVAIRRRLVDLVPELPSERDVSKSRRTTRIYLVRISAVPLPCGFFLSTVTRETDGCTRYYRKDATLREILTTLRSTAPQTPEYRHPLARYSFRSIYFDAHASSRQNRDSRSAGSYSSKDLGIVYSRDILGDPGSITTGIAPRLLEDEEPQGNSDGQKTLEDLKFVPGDFLSVAVLLPKNSTVVVGSTGDIAVKGAAGATDSTTSGPANGWKSGVGLGRDRDRDTGWGGPAGRGSGGHWRGESNAPSPAFGGRGRGGGSGRGRDKDRDRDDDYRRVPPPRKDRDSPPPRRGGRGGGRRRSKDSRSRSPPRRNPRYD